MTLAVSYDGRRALLARLLPYLGTLFVRLYTSDLHPHPERPTSAYVEPTFPGYRPLALKSWGTVYLSPRGEARTDHARVRWTVGAGGGSDTVYGYWVSDPTGRWLWAERDDRGGQLLAIAGTIYAVVPSLSLGTICSLPLGAWDGGMILGGSWLSEV